MAWPKGKKRAPETLKKLSEASKRMWSDPEYKKRLGKLQKRSWEDPEIRKKRTDPHFGDTRSEETRRKMSTSRRKRRGGHTDPVLIERMLNARRGNKNTVAHKEAISEHKTQWHEDHPELSQEIISKAAKANQYFNNKLELAFARILDDLGIKYEKQGRIKSLAKPFCFHKWDFLIPEVKLAVELDGCYWHGCPAHHPAQQDAVREQVELDRDVEAQNECWIVLRFWEHDLHENTGAVSSLMHRMVSRRRSVAVA